jgi:hypothetical protein
MNRLLIATFACFACALAVSCSGAEPEVPVEVSKLLAYYTGDWSVEVTVGDAKYKGNASFRMPDSKHCTIGTVSVRSKQDSLAFSLVTGWDSSTGWLTEQGSATDGTVYKLTWKNVSPNVDEGELVGTCRGVEVTERNRIERKSDDEMIVTCTERKDGDKSLPDMTLVYQRRTKKAAAKSATN